MPVLRSPRDLCGLSGLHTVLAIDGAIPVLHAGASCANLLHQGMAVWNGHQGGGAWSGAAVPCDNLHRPQIVFGGEERLRALLSGTREAVGTGFQVVFQGCAPGLAGDDVLAVAARERSAGGAVAAVGSPGCSANAPGGHEQVVRAIVEQLVEMDRNRPIDPILVNVWSSVPGFDPFWCGDLEALGELLSWLGLSMNVLFGPGSGLANWKRVPEAAFNLVVSPWVGVGTAEFLERRFGTRWLHRPLLPVGPRATRGFLEAVARFAGLDAGIIEPRLRAEEERFRHHLLRAGEFLCGADLRRRFSVAGDALFSAAVCRFLSDDIGLSPQRQWIVDDPPERFREAIADLFRGGGSRPEVVFSTDSSELERHLETLEEEELPVILGGGEEGAVARRRKAPFLGVGIPLSDRLVLDRTYVGIRGGLRLLEDLCAVLLEDR